MPVEMNIEKVRAQLEQLRVDHGEAVYEQARRDLALALIDKTNGEEHIRLAFPDMNIEELKAQAAAAKVAAANESPEQTMMRMLQQQIPSIKTQAHFNLFQAAFDALRTTLDGSFSGDAERARRGREALLKVLDTAGTVPQVLEKLNEMPAEARSAIANEFLEPPRQFHEFDTQRRLMTELGNITTLARLEAWYTDTKSDRDRVTSQKLRNELLDGVRAKKAALKVQEN